MGLRVADWIKAIVAALLIIVTYLLIGRISHTILLFVAAGFIVFIISPLIGWLVDRDVKRGLAILMTYLLFLGLVTLFFVILGPIVAEQLAGFVNSLPDYFSALRRQANFLQEWLRDFPFLRGLDLDLNPDTLLSQAASILTSQAQVLLGLIPSVFGFLTDLILVFVISIYILIFLPRADKYTRSNLPERIIPVYENFLASMRGALSKYFLGQLLLMFSVGLLSGIGVWLIGLPYSALLGLWAGITEIIPVVGPILGAIPAIIVALTIDPILALWVVLVFVLVQQLESQVLAPLVLGGTVGLNPLVMFFGIIAGGEIAGILGIFLAVPTLVVIASILRFITENFAYVRVEDGPDRIIIRQAGVHTKTPAKAKPAKESAKPSKPKVD